MPTKYTRSVILLIAVTLVGAAIFLVGLNGGQDADNASHSLEVRTETPDPPGASIAGKARNEPPDGRSTGYSATPTESAGRVTGDSGELRRALRRAALADRLPAESLLFSGETLSGSAVETLLDAADFPGRMDRLEGDMLGDPLADEIGSHYRDEIRRQLEESDVGLELDRFACGLRACAGALREIDPAADPSAWLQRFHDDPQTLHHIVVTMAHANPNGTRELRFVFTIDPASSSVSAPMFPPPGG